MGPDQTVEIMRRLLIEAMMLAAPLLVTACAGEPCCEPDADADRRAGADFDGGSETGSRVRRHACCAAMDGASADWFHRAFVYRLP